ncbi:glycine cleavage system protein H [Anaeromyxobacter oryzisoli]|jgi:glycine cleavage system H protein|uniref:glycine cleavage system protein H n=1 Tax=Anaeromyxobacter oryzisoli TaxID=2925408 RepID=UPI001F560AAC|nr:glycine cleavage system protein H [Anaeromyxobacter sp. SG63]
MQALIEMLEAIGVFLAGVVARIGIFLAMIAVLLVPALLVAAVLHGIAARRERRLGIRDVAGVPFRPDLFYSPGHLWLHRRAGGTVEVGLDGLAQRLMPSVTSVEVARPGTAIARGEPLVTLHGGGRALVIPAPVGGKVAGLNVAVARDPGLVKREGYGRGWLVAVEPEDLGYAAMPHGETAEAWMRHEAGRWNQFVERRLGFAAADGGALVAPAPWLLGDEGWRALAAEFIH